MRVDGDDVLFLLPDAPEPLAVVELTDSSASDGKDSANLPRTTFYSSLDDWLSRGMAADHADYISGNSDPTDDN